MLVYQALVERAMRRLEDDARYHESLFSDPSFAVIRSEIDNYCVPNDLSQLGTSLIEQCAALPPLAIGCLRAMATACAAQRIKAMRVAAAERVRAHVDRVSRTLDGVGRTVAVSAESRAEIAEIVAEVSELAPTPSATDADSDGESLLDDMYF